MKKKSKFSTYNDGVLFVCNAKTKEASFGAVVNAKKNTDIIKIVKLAFEEQSKRDEDIDFAESHGRTLSIKVKTMLCDKADAKKKVLIGDTLYSIINLDYDKKKKEMYFYLEEERSVKP